MMINDKLLYMCVALDDSYNCLLVLSDEVVGRLTQNS